MGKILGEIKILGIKEIPDLELQNNYKMETTPETEPETDRESERQRERTTQNEREIYRERASEEDKGPRRVVGPAVAEAPPPGSRPRGVPRQGKAESEAIRRV